MNTTNTNLKNKVIFIAQLCSLLLMWIFVISIALWILNLILVALDLNDAPGISLAISIVAIPIFFTLASILTYVFVGFHKAKR